VENITEVSLIALHHIKISIQTLPFFSPYFKKLMENQLTGIVSKQNETEKKFESVFKSLLQKMDKVNQHLSETSELRNEIDNKLIYLFTHNRYLKLPDSFVSVVL